MQRVELVSANNFAPGLRFTFRTITHFTNFQVDEGDSSDARGLSSRRRTTFAPADSLERYRDWRSELGSASAATSTTDLDDIAPPIWRTDGPPRLTWFGSRIDRMVHFNRVEGLYTGVEGSLQFRDVAPGTVARAWAGWAWSEQTARGGASLSRAWSRSSSAIVAERRLVNTQDFQRDFADLGVSFASFISSTEEIDWVDRASVSLSHVRIIESMDKGLVTMRLSAARDADVQANLAHGPIARRRQYVANRHARDGSYVLGALGYEFHPNVTGAYSSQVFGASLNVEAATGELEWVRAEGSASLRRYLGPLTLALRADAGAVVSDNPPPQTLFELGGLSARLAGYSYKEFAGDRAAVARAYSNYGFPILRAPRRLGRLLIPGLSPGIAAGIDAGWAELSSAAAHAAVLEMGDGTSANALSRETGRIRSTVFVGATFFATAVQVGVARPIDHVAPWRFSFRLGQGF